MPAPILFLESASGYGAPVTNQQAISAAKVFIHTLRYLKRANSRISLSTNQALPDCELAPGETLQKVLSGNSYRDEWLFLKDLQTRTPLSSGLKALVNQVALAEIKLPLGRASTALTWAHILETGTISFHTDPLWRHSIINAQHEYLDDQGSLHSCAVAIRNASEPAHIDVHQPWLVNLGLESHPSSKTLWEERAARFPGLRFLDRVKSHIDYLATSGAPYKQAIATLQALNETAVDWNGFGEPSFSVKNAAGEHDQRRKLCKFNDETTGQVCDFGRHAYFTGNFPGRVHFRMSVEERKIVVGHVGYKLID
ncbi:MAG: hypothetical protein IPL05_15020 [Betaproteobacteria bacterium]|jgi:hypothetical protein|nr:hypothetical protein [Betaproteobacteria bacterium]